MDTGLTPLGGGNNKTAQQNKYRYRTYNCKYINYDNGDCDE